jgi:REP element-mobilizing transposase RayT
VILVPTLRVGTQVPTLRVEDSMSRSRYRIYDSAFPHFLTCTVVGWLPVFTRPETVAIVLDSWRYLQDSGRMTVLGYVILENHLHFIASSDSLSTQVGDFKSYTARRVIDFLEERGADTLLKQLRFEKARHKSDRPYQVWQEGSHPQQILNESMMRQKLEYMHYNPVKRGYVDDPLHWRYSSARNYAGLDGLFPVVTDWLYGELPGGGPECLDAERRDLRSHAERGNER